MDKKTTLSADLVKAKMIRQLATELSIERKKNVTSEQLTNEALDDLIKKYEKRKKKNDRRNNY